MLHNKILSEREAKGRGGGREGKKENSSECGCLQGAHMVMRQEHGNSASVRAWEHGPSAPRGMSGILQGQEGQAFQQGDEFLESKQLSELSAATAKSVSLNVCQVLVSTKKNNFVVRNSPL